MTRLILTTACATAVLGLAACGYDKDEYNNQAGYNADESNYSDAGANFAAPANDLNIADTNDMNMSDAGSAASNETTGDNAGY